MLEAPFPLHCPPSWLVGDLSAFSSRMASPQESLTALLPGLLAEALPIIRLITDP